MVPFYLITFTLEDNRKASIEFILRENDINIIE